MEKKKITTLDLMIDEYKQICNVLRRRGKEQERAETFNVINDYITILKDERIIKNIKFFDSCFNLIWTICEELKEYENDDLIDYYEEETATAVKKAYLEALKEVTNEKRDLKNLYVVFYLNDKELLSYTLVDEIAHERAATIQLLAYENNCETDDIKAVKEWRQPNEKK